MYEGKVVIGMRVLIGSDRLLELRHHRVKSPLLIEPMGTEMHPDRRQTGLELDDLGSGGRRPSRRLVTRTALGSIELPPTPQAIEMAHTDVKGSMSLGDLVEQKSARALRVVVKEFPHQGLVDLTELSTGTKGWT